MTHAIRRTSPKGQKFLGVCIKCGAAGLGMSGALDECPMDGPISDADALLHLIAPDTDARELAEQKERDE